MSKQYSVYYHKSPDGRVYVGQTSLSLYRRSKGNGSGYKFCEPMWSAIQKYGWDSFEHIIVAENLTAKDADKLEQKVISDFDSTNPIYGFNSDYGGSSSKIFSENTKRKMSKAKSGRCGVNLGKTFTKEHRKNLSKSHKGIKQSKETIDKRAKAQEKPVSQYSLTNRFIREWDSLKQAAECVGVNNSNITNACKGRYKTAGGFIWKYSNI